MRETQRVPGVAESNTRLDSCVALVVLGVASTDGEASTAVRLVGALIVLDVTRPAERSGNVQEAVAASDEETTTTGGDGGCGKAAHWEGCKPETPVTLNRTTYSRQ